MSNIVRIFVASHKPYWMPEDPIYVPMQVGVEGKEEERIPGFYWDNVGENISLKNPYYCELTALYWAWKNCDADYVGLVHYRRHFKGNADGGVLSVSEASLLLEDKEAILPKKRHYYITSVEKHYASTFDSNHLTLVRKVLEESYPAYLPEFNHRMRMTSAHMFNMFVMRKDILDDYCEWLFDILERIEEQLDFSSLSTFEARCMGRISERLLDTWLAVNCVSYSEVPVISTEKVDWVKKGSSFMRAVLFGKKYKESF